jgi:hypothetical protein
LHGLLGRRPPATGSRRFPLYDEHDPPLTDGSTRISDRPVPEPEAALEPDAALEPEAPRPRGLDRVLLARSPVAAGIATAAVAWGLGWLLVFALTGPTPSSFAKVVAVPAAGLVAWLAWLSRRLWLPATRSHPVAAAMVAGVAAGAAVELLGWEVQTIYRADGVTMSRSLLSDLAITVPWYVLLVRSFTLVQHRRRFPLPQVLLLGAVYGLGAQLVVGGLLLDAGPGSWAVWAIIGLAGFWQLIPAYAAIVGLPAMILEGTARPDPVKGPAFLDALRPLAWLLLYLAWALLARAIGG